VVVKAPFHTSPSVIEKAIKEKSAWIIRSLSKFSSLIMIDNTNGYEDGDKILLFGRYFSLRLYQAQKFYVRLRDDDTIETGYQGEKTPSLIKAMLEKWFRSVARDKLTEKFREVLSRYSSFDFRPAGLTVRKMKTRWGSCSYKGKIAISYDLIRLADIFGEYVIIHELCHLKHHNHSAEYYRLLSEVYPGWKEVRKELKKYIR
jgi:hypothetical protein